MNALRCLCSCALALSLVPSTASADEPSLAEVVQRRVETGLVKLLAEREAGVFSRSRPPPRERRVRVLQPVATVDANGRPFVAFAIDVRFGAEWRENDVVGCAYTASGELFVKKGTAYRPASYLLGKNAGPVAGACQPASG